MGVERDAMRARRTQLVFAEAPAMPAAIARVLVPATVGVLVEVAVLSPVAGGAT